MIVTTLWMLLGLASMLGVLWLARGALGLRDAAYLVIAGAWLVWLTAEQWQGDDATGSVLAAVARLSCQCMWLGAAVLLCSPAQTRAMSPGWRTGLLGGFALIGSVLVLLADRSAFPGIGANMTHLWLTLNVLGGATVVWLLAQDLFVRATAGGWMALLIAISGFSVLISDWQAMRAGQWEVSGHHFFLIAALFAFWLAARRRITDPPPTGWMDRRQLAQELHDGVGSQLVGLLSTLDRTSPQQRLTVASVQNCLLELKLLVDDMDSDASLMSHLASLRYRMHPLLEGAGIRMEWLVTNEERLLRVRGDPARHVLRLTQEALANVIRHSQARTVTVLCRHQAETDSLLLCVADDGTGLGPERRNSLGKGLSGMQRRAQAVGGRLRIESNAEGGTLIQLVVPMARLLSGRARPLRPAAAPPATRTPG